MSGSVDYGIDLGTTNSAVARFGTKSIEVIPVKRLNYIPSAVAATKRGDLKVGAEALRPDFEPVARRFKKLMGTKNSVSLSDGSSWSPEMLSAEVLKVLKAAVKLKDDVELTDVVITVPAMFMQPQCEATIRAASMAGLNAVALLQEPIAAATAYLNEANQDGNYLVYDLGGGTFDVSLISLRKGEMAVLEHGGDNNLGGSDFDRLLLDWSIDQLEKNGADVAALRSSASRFLLATACEEAKIALSDGDIATIYLDELDVPIEKLEVNRDILNALIDDTISRTIQMSKKRLEPRSLRASDVVAVLLVGGPTQSPHIRERLRKELGIPLNLDQDPMTVVAKGAAIHASSILKGQSVSVPKDSSTLSVNLFYDPVSPDQNATVAGRVLSPDDFRGEVRISTVSEDWETGWRPLVNGAFSFDLSLKPGVSTQFEIHIRDLQGMLRTCEPSGFSIRVGLRSAQPVAPYDYGVVMDTGRAEKVLMSGTPLPASTSHMEFALARTLVAQSPDECSVYFFEGNSPLAEDNICVGEIAIRGTDLPRTLKEGETVEVRIQMDDRRKMKATVFIPLLDLDYVAELKTSIESPPLQDLENAITETSLALKELEQHVAQEDQSLIIQTERRLDQLETMLERVRMGELGESESIHKQLADTKAEIRPLRDRYGPKALHSKVMRLIEKGEKLARQFNDQLNLGKLDDCRTDADRALKKEDNKELERIRLRALDLFWDNYMKTPECWEYQCAVIREDAPKAKDQLTYWEIVRRAEQALAQKDYEGVRIEMIKSWKLLPDPAKAENRFHGAALRRK